MGPEELLEGRGELFAFIGPSCPASCPRLSEVFAERFGTLLFRKIRLQALGEAVLDVQRDNAVQS